MKTDDLLELWETDVPTIGGRVSDVVGAQPAVIGGSLADDLGTLSSDVDVYVFVEDQEIAAPRSHSSGLAIETMRLGGPPAPLHLHLVRASNLREPASGLACLLTDGEDNMVPLFSFDRLLVFHSLARGIPLMVDSKLEDLRNELAVDLFPLYASLRSITAFVSHARFLGGLRDGGEDWTIALAARSCAEAALDAALASTGYTNPNHKWRIALAKRAVMGQALEIPSDDLAAALFPDVRDPDRAVKRCLAAAHRWIGIACRNPLIRTYRVAQEGDAFAASLSRGE